MTSLDPLVIWIDVREKAPYSFLDLATLDGRQISLGRARIPEGDYAAFGPAGRVLVERKSVDDLFQTIGRARRRFESELRRLSTNPHVSAVVVEGGEEDIRCHPPCQSMLPAAAVIRAVHFWRAAYPQVAWHLCPGGRREAEIVTLRLLERSGHSQQPQAAAVTG